MKINKETPGIEIEILCEEEYESPEGCFASDEPELDSMIVKGIKDRLNSGDLWAWFCAHVRVTYNGFVGDDYLGACSYENEADFRNGGYFDDMVDMCIDQINAQIEKAEHLEACEHCKAVQSGKYPAPTV